MSLLKGLDAIAVTDHNACFNLPYADRCAREAGITFIPGIEVTTLEEVHILVYFSSLQNAMNFGDILYGSLLDINNNEALFGEQLIIDENDIIIGRASKMLAQASPFTIHTLEKKAKEFGGFLLPAHVNRTAYSVLETLGFIPDELDVTTLEVRRNIPLPSGLAKRYQLISSSDAHDLGQILERIEFLEVEDQSMNSVIKALRHMV
jgi:PHP family Zn ribbon phosphoesterase